MSDFEYEPSEFDLKIERTVDVPPELVWQAWTTPEQLMQWFTPDPWKTIKCEIDLRPGGRFHTTMQSPEGENYPNTGCYLDVVENKRLIWTDALDPGYRPSSKSILEQFSMTAILLLEPSGSGTKYTAIALHKNEADRKKHEDMGFHDGWGTVLDQLVAFIKKNNDL